MRPPVGRRYQMDEDGRCQPEELLTAHAGGDDPVEPVVSAVQLAGAAEEHGVQVSGPRARPRRLGAR